MSFDWSTSLLVDQRDALADRAEMQEAELVRLRREVNRLRRLLRDVAAAARELTRDQAREERES